MKKSPRGREPRKSKAKVPAPERTHVKSPYGKIPMVPDEDSGRSGRLKCDPDFQPELPKGAVRGDIHRQEFCWNCHWPKYFYVDESRRCVDCSEDFVFGAKEQKFWYEDLGFNFSSKAIRCVECRKARRNEQALRDQLAKATALADADDATAAELVDYVKTVYAYFQHFGEGDLSKAVSKARKAYKLDPQNIEVLYWEAACQDLGNFHSKALHAYEQFLESFKTGRQNQLSKDARARVVAIKELA